MKTYKVWIEIEEYDDETESGETMDAPGASLAEFDTYEKAWKFAERVTELFGDDDAKIAADLPKPEATDGENVLG